MGTAYARGVRGDGSVSALRMNYPDGSLTDPAFWWGLDGTGQYDWAPYGAGGPATPFNTYAVGVLGEWGGQRTAGDARHGAGLLPSITRATSLIVGPVVRTVWRYYRRDAGAGLVGPISDATAGNTLIARPLWVADPQLCGRIPGGELPRPTLPRGRRIHAHAFWSTLLTHALWWGNGALLYAVDKDGQPLAGSLRILNPTTWGWTEDGRLALGLHTDEPVEADEDNRLLIGATEWRVALLQGPGPHDGIVSPGVLLKMGLVASIAERTSKYLNGIYASGVPSGVLKVSTPNFTAAQAAALKRQWSEAHNGDQRSVAVLSSTIDYSPLQLSVVDADAVALKGAMLTDIAHGFNLPAAALDATTGGSSLTYSNLQDQRRDTLDHSLANMGHNVQDFISALMPWQQGMLIDWGSYVNTDVNNGIEFVSAGLADGWLTQAEARDRMKLPPIEDQPQAPAEGAPNA
jgi:HK97 family phage portal protein